MSEISSFDATDTSDKKQKSEKDISDDTLKNKVVNFAINNKKLLVVATILLILFLVYWFGFKSEGMSLGGLASPSGVVARRSQRQIRDDSHFSQSWNLKELEKSVDLLNRKASGVDI